MSEMESRVLSIVLAGAKATLPVDPSTDPVLFDGEGWSSNYDAGASTMLLYNIKKIDLSGYSLQEKTLFPQGILMQDMDTLPVGVNMGTAVPVKRATIVSTTPISLEDLTNSNGDQWHLPGALGSNHSLQNILGGRMLSYLQLDTYAGLQQVAGTTWGSGDSTAADAMWICEAYLLPSIASLNFYIPDSSIVLPSLIDKEPELEYFMRLARSVEPVY